MSVTHKQTCAPKRAPPPPPLNKNKLATSATSATTATAEASVDKQLVDAVKKGSVAEVRRLLPQGAVQSLPTIFAQGGMTLLHYAAECGCVEVAELIISSLDGPNGQSSTDGAEGGSRSIDAKTVGFGWTPLHRATYCGHVAMVSLLANCGANINAPNKYGFTALHLTVQPKGSHNSEIMEVLFDKGANVNSENKNGETPLHLAVRHGQTPLAEILLAHGANLEAATNEGVTPLHTAAYDLGRTQLLRLLVEKGANLEAAKKDGRRPLHIAAQYGHTEAARVLISSGADIGAATPKDGWTPLHMAAMGFGGATDEVLKLLLSNGADAGATSHAGETALQVCQDECLRKVLEAI